MQGADTNFGLFICLLFVSKMLYFLSFTRPQSSKEKEDNVK